MLLASRPDLNYLRCQRQQSGASEEREVWSEPVFPENRVREASGRQLVTCVCVTAGVGGHIPSQVTGVDVFADCGGVLKGKDFVP